MLCLDVGNTQIHAGIYQGDKLLSSFRLNTKQGWTADQLGVFILSFLRERELAAGLEIKEIAVCSVVPTLDHPIRSMCLKYFQVEPFFIKSGIKTGLKIRYKNPHEIGADLIASSIAGLHHHPGQNLIIASLGTATVLIAVSKDKDFYGGSIMPGVNTELQSLAQSAEKLFLVEIKQPECVIGKNTTECIQSGIYYSHLAAIKDVAKRAALECFGKEEFMLLGSGGFASLFASEKVFSAIHQELVLEGLLLAYNMNAH